MGPMALQRAVYRPRDAEDTVLHQVSAEHLEVFLRAVAEAGDGAGLPQFVEREFRELLSVRTRCGAAPVRGLRARAPGTVLVQRAGVVSQFWWSPDDGARRASGGRGAAVDADAAGALAPSARYFRVPPPSIRASTLRV